ncbi:MAG: medium chain dehydrogenase/reductase family protein [Minicystis sp.]
MLEVRETPDPAPKAGEVRVRVRAAGLNFAEVMARQGLYPDAPPTPSIVGYEASGVVDAVGEGVTTPTVGTRVMALSRFGAHSDTLVVPAAQALPIPERMTFEEAAAIPVNYITAYHMLFRVANLRPRGKVLIHMAAGGVGIAALQLCRTVRDVVTIGTASASKHDVLRAEGCNHPIDYRSVDYAEEVQKLTSNRGVDIILDALGGKDWKKGIGLLAPAGLLIAFGFANMASGEKRNIFNVVRQAVGIPLFTPMSLMNTNRGVAGVNIGHLWHEMDMLKEELDAIVALYNEGKIKPRVSDVVPFDRAADAHRIIQERRNVGKVVLVP